MNQIILNMKTVSFMSQCKFWIWCGIKMLKTTFYIKTCQYYMNAQHSSFIDAFYTLNSKLLGLSEWTLRLCFESSGQVLCVLA